MGIKSIDQKNFNSNFWFALRHFQNLVILPWCPLVRVGTEKVREFQGQGKVRE